MFNALAMKWFQNTTVPSGCSRCSFSRTPGRLLRRMLASVALRTSIGSLRRSRRIQKEAEGNRSSR